VVAEVLENAASVVPGLDGIQDPAQFASGLFHERRDRRGSSHPASKGSWPADFDKTIYKKVTAPWKT
jgi:hypothetical protein